MDGADGGIKPDRRKPGDGRGSRKFLEGGAEVSEGAKKGRRG